MSGRTRLHAVVRGHVQGVGYRFFVRRRARDLGLTGFVRNLPDHTVEVQAQGERQALEALVEHLRKGPMGALVRGVDVRWYPPGTESADFEVRY